MTDRTRRLISGRQGRAVKGDQFLTLFAGVKNGGFLAGLMSQLARRVGDTLSLNAPSTDDLGKRMGIIATETR
jgi:hypothetical protein